MAIHRPGRNSEDAGGLEFVAAAARQGSLDESPGGLIDSGADGDGDGGTTVGQHCLGGALRSRGGEGELLDCVTGGQGNSPLHDMFELADITGPRVLHQLVEGLRGDQPNRL